MTPTPTSAYTSVTSFTAAVISANINSLYAITPKPDKQTQLDWKHHLDGCATTAMEQALKEIPYQSISVGSEGAKEASKAGVAAPSLDNKKYGSNGDPSVTIMTDVIEGTTFASRNQPGASSVLAAYENESSEFGIMPSRDDLHYLFKFFGPSQAKGVVDPEKSHKENLKNLLDALNLSNPNDLVQITLDPDQPGRDCNTSVVSQANELGLDVRLIEQGDFIAGLKVISQPQDGEKYMILVGRGGYEEGIMNAVAAHAMGGFAQIQIYDKENRVIIPEVLDMDTIVSEDALRASVYNSFITDENMWFNKPGVTLEDDEYTVTTLVTTSKGFEFITTKFQQEEIDALIFAYGTF